LAQAQIQQEKQVVIEKKVEVEKRKLSYKEKEEFKKIEKEMETLETEKATIVEQLSSGNLTNKEVYDLGIKLGKITEEIESKTERWMELAEFA
jgi:ATP-binding cassette subfamily F protein uup